ncbi:myosin IC heavy chain-like [Corvus kubaryi]|uniref:myosin IC heavy chain-like n=1 Tax=Corvus kubaryi TaxID=68294 RepID=UPI001C052D43|nr:myosin IC heavy chain-like [Corvus kubaryi]
MIARSPRPGSGRGERVPPGRPRAGRGWPRGVPAEGPHPAARTGGGPAGQQGGQRPGKRSICPGPSCLRGSLPPQHPSAGPGPGERSGHPVPPRLPRTGAPLPSPVPAAEPGTAGPARAAAERRFPRRGPGRAGPPGGERGPGPPCPSPGAVSANSRDSVFGGGNKSHPTHSPDRNVCHCLPITRG